MHVLKTSLALSLLSVSMAWCQVHPANEAVPRRGDIYVGPVFTGNLPSNASAGLGGGVSFHVMPWLPGVGEFNVVVGTSSVANTVVVSNYLFGPRISRPLRNSSRATPFGDFLIGGQALTNSSSQHSYYYGNGGGMAIAADGGLDFGLSRHFALRGEGGYLYSRYATPPTTTSNSRGRGA